MNPGFSLLIPNIGPIIPIMGNSPPPTSISNVLFSGVQRRVLGLLFGRPDDSFYTNQIAKLIDTGRGSLQRELEQMTAAGIVSMQLIGRQKHYQANRDSPIFQEIRSITLKTFGLADVLRQALSDHVDAIRHAFIYGSVAKGTDSASSDVDVMVIAEGLGYSPLFECLAHAEDILGRKVSPTLYTPKEFLARVRDSDHFVSRVLGQPRIDLLGHENDILPGKPAKPAKNRQAQGRTA